MERLKNIALFLLTLLVFCLATLQLFQYQKSRRERDQQLLKVQADSVQRAQFYQYSLAYGDFVDVPLKRDMILTDANKNQIRVAEAITKRTYIFHFDETNCFTCVERYIPYLLRLSKKLGPEHVMIIGSYQNPINLFIVLQPFKLDGIKIYNLLPSYLSGHKIGSINMPYVFEMSAALGTERFYIPEKDFPELSELYEKNTPY